MSMPRPAMAAHDRALCRHALSCMSGRLDARHTDPVETPGTDWFAVRCVFEFGPAEREGGEVATYEERITLWHTRNFDEAFTHAEADADSYAETVGSRFLGLSQAYRLAETPGHGAEVFSLMRDSQLAVSEYISSFFATGAERQRRR
jgi:hypothetical protein